MADPTIINGEKKYKKYVGSPVTRERFWLLFKKCLPISSWITQYSLKHLQCDIIAGLTVGLMVVPQAIAYASIARLPSKYGLYSAFMGCFVYCLLGTSKDITLGPTAILSLLVSTYSVDSCGDMAVALSFCVGVILLLMGIFQLGFLLRFLSVPVISAFTSAAAITIACGQIRDLNGIARTPRDFFGNLTFVLKKIKSWNFYDLGYGLACIVILFLMRLLSKFKTDEVNMSRGNRVFFKFLWFCGIARNALVVIVSCVIMYIIQVTSSRSYFTHVKALDTGLPAFSLPDLNDVQCRNRTYTFVNILGQFGSGLAVIPLIAFLEAAAIGKAFSQLNLYKISPSQELVALGLANLMGCFVSAYPVTGSFSRTAVNSQSGVRTPLAGLFSGSVVIIATQFLGHLFCYIPKACLGAIIMSAVLPMVNISVVRTMWKVKKLDLVPYLGTFLGSFYSLEVGLGIGFVVSICIVLYHVSKLQVEKVTVPSKTVIKLHGGLLYPGAAFVMERIEEVAKLETPPRILIIDVEGVFYVDFTALVELEQVLDQIQSNSSEVKVFIINVNFEVLKILLKTGINKYITSQEIISNEFEREEPSSSLPSRIE